MTSTNGSVILDFLDKDEKLKTPSQLLSLFWFLWDVEEPTVLFVKSRGIDPGGVLQPLMGWVGNGGVDINIIVATEVLFHPLSLCWVLWRITIKKLSITKTLHYKIINLQYAVKPLVSNHPNAKIFLLDTHCTGDGYWWESNPRSLFQEKVLRHLRFWTVDGLWELVT